MGRYRKAAEQGSEEAIEALPEIEGQQRKEVNI